MADIKLDIEPLYRAIQRLKEGLSRFEQNESDDQLRDGLIQRFEFTYELSHKMLKRFLEVTSASPAEYDEMTFQDLIRTGNERGLLKGDWTNWKRYRDMRAKTSHAYAEEIAMDVVSEIPAFLDEADQLAARLRAELS